MTASLVSPLSVPSSIKKSTRGLHGTEGSLLAAHHRVRWRHRHAHRLLVACGGATRAGHLTPLPGEPSLFTTLLYTPQVQAAGGEGTLLARARLSVTLFPPH